MQITTLLKDSPPNFLSLVMQFDFLKIFLLVLAFCLFSCAGSKKNIADQILSEQRSSRLPDSLNRKWKSGIDITAAGLSPATWALEVDFDREISFTSADGNNLRLIPVFKKTEEKDQTIFSVSSGDTTLDIILNDSPCPYQTTSNTTKMVSVKLGTRTYSGCGQYLYNNQLNDVWELTSINSQPVSKKDFGGKIPSLYFQLASGEIEGYDGCAGFKGKVSIQGTRIKFSTLTGLAGNCKNPIVRNIISDHLNQKMADYQLSQNNLLLYLEDDSKLLFTRKQF